MKWFEYLPLVEFYYNNIYNSSIRMPPFGALYGHDIVSLVVWHDLVGRVVISRQMLENMEAQTRMIREILRGT